MKTLIATLILCTLIPLDALAQLERPGALEFAFELARSDREQSQAWRALQGLAEADPTQVLAEADEASTLNPALEQEFQIVLVPTTKSAHP